MGTRKDGDQTRVGILNAACAVFSEKGFSAATHAEMTAEQKLRQFLRSLLGQCVHFSFGPNQIDMIKGFR
ncbi:MAG: hypothetical protein P9M14_04230 [Candidatus Alcyoniella australis]|nr:hypothetical protein [Candidatus Alcyoniella australis]